MRLNGKSEADWRNDFHSGIISDDRRDSQMIITDYHGNNEYDKPTKGGGYERSNERNSQRLSLSRVDTSQNARNLAY